VETAETVGTFADSLVDTVHQIASILIDSPEEMDVLVSTGVRTVVIRLRVKEEDVGKIIGRRGNTIEAMRTLLKAAGGRNHQRVELEVSSAS
jgi:uncharacterized protein